jgi:hypothetical protein
VTAVVRPEASSRGDTAIARVIDLVLHEGHAVVAVDSPPGAGKTRLVESVTAIAVERLGLRVAVVTPRLDQSHDLLRRLSLHFAATPIQVLQSEERELPADLTANARIAAPVSHVRDLVGGPGVVVGVAAKFVISVPAFRSPDFDLLICDEAYQLAYKDFAPLFHIAEQILLVGDPGQLAPLIRVETARFEAAPCKVHWATPREVRRRFLDVPVVRLPLTMRLPQDTVELIGPSFYPDLPFASAASATDRRVRFASLGMNTAVDRALDMVTGGATIVGILLPARDLPDEIDAEVADLEAEVVSRVLERAAHWRGDTALTASDIGCLDAHVASGAAVRHSLRRRGISTDEVKVDTPEVWQGGERPITVVKHPLGGRSRLDAFGLEPGRWCVMLSRHQAACVIVGRDGVGELLDRHEHDCAARPMGADNTEWRGWRAHHHIWTELERQGRIVRHPA